MSHVAPGVVNINGSRRTVPAFWQILMGRVRRLWDARFGAGGHFGDSRSGGIDEPPEAPVPRQKTPPLLAVTGGPCVVNLSLSDRVEARIEPPRR